MRDFVETGLDVTLDHPLVIPVVGGEIAHLGTLSLKGTTTTPVDVTVKLPKAPKRVVLNAFNDVLSLN